MLVQGLPGKVKRLVAGRPIFERINELLFLRTDRSGQQQRIQLLP